MALINRISRLFTADMHAVLDRIEEPDVLLKHAVREMEEELARSEHLVRRIEHEREVLDERIDRASGARGELTEQLEVCFAHDNEELARKVLKRRLETERLERHLQERIKSVDKDLTARREATLQQREQLDVMRQKAELLASSSPVEDLDRVEFAVDDHEVEVAFLRERQRRHLS